MPSRRPPSQRDPAYAGLRLVGTVSQVLPGAKVRNASPVPAKAAPRVRTPTAISAVLSISTLAGGPPTDGSVFWAITDVACTDCCSGLAGIQMRVNIGGAWKNLGCVTDVPVPPSRVGATSAPSGGGSSTLAVVGPVGVVTGDLLLMLIQLRGSTVTTPTGWTLVRSDDATGAGEGERAYSFYRIADVTDESPTAGQAYNATMSGNDNAVIHLCAYRGVSTVAVNAGTPSPPGGPDIHNVVAPSVTAAASGMLVCLFGINCAGWGRTLSTPTGMTLTTSQASADYVVSLVAEEIVAAGATGTRSAPTSSYVGVFSATAQSLILT